MDLQLPDATSRTQGNRIDPLGTDPVSRGALAPRFRQGQRATGLGFGAQVIDRQVAPDMLKVPKQSVDARPAWPTTWDGERDGRQKRGRPTGAGQENTHLSSRPRPTRHAR